MDSNACLVNTALSRISEEEAQQVQEKMDGLRIRCSVLSLSSLDVLQRLEQALEASSRCTSSQEDLHLWLGRIERELLGAAGTQTHVGDTVLCAAERQRVMFPVKGFVCVCISPAALCVLVLFITDFCPYFLYYIFHVIILIYFP